MLVEAQAANEEAAERFGRDLETAKRDASAAIEAAQKVVFLAFVITPLNCHAFLCLFLLHLIVFF